MNNTLTKIIEGWIGFDRDEDGFIFQNQALSDLRSRVPGLVELFADEVIKLVRAGTFSGSFSEGCECEACNKHAKKLRKDIINSFTSN
jgi:hypothetical protein